MAEFDAVKATANLKSKGYSDDAIGFYVKQKQAGSIKPLRYSEDNPTFNIENKAMFAKPYSEDIGPIGDFFSNTYNATIPELTKGIVELPNLLVGVAGSDVLKKGTDNAVDWIDKRLGMYVDPAFQKGMFNLDEKGDLSFTDARSFANGLGQGIGSFLSMLIPGGIAAKAGAGAKVATMIGATLTSIPMLYKGGKEAGLSNQANSAMTLTLAPIIGMLENVGGMEAGMLRKMMGKEAEAEVKSATTRTLTEALGKLGKSLTKDDFVLTAKEALNGLRPILGRVLNKNVAKNAWGEFEEEYLQNIVQEGSEQLYDTFFADKNATEGKGRYHSPENELLIKEGQGITGGSASISPVDWIAKGMDMRYNKQVFKDDLGAAIYGGIIGHGLTAITTPIVNQSLYGYIQTASDKASRATPRVYGQMGPQAGGQQAVQALGAITQKMFQSGKIDQAGAQQIMQTVQQMAETAHNLSGIKDMTPAVSYDAYNAQYNLRPAMQQQVAGYEQAMAQVAQMTQATDQSGQPIIGPAEAPDLIKLADAQKNLAEGYDNYMRSKDMLKAIHEHINHIVQGDFKDGKVDGGNIMEVAKRIAKNKYDITKNPDMKGPMAGYTPKAQKKAQKPAPAVTVSQLIGQPVTMNGVAGTVAKDEKGVYVFHPEGEAAVVPIGDKDAPAKDLGIVHDENIKPVKPKTDTIQKPSTEKKVSPVGEGGENIPQDGGGVGQGKQGDEVAGADNAQKPAETPAETPPVEVTWENTMKPGNKITHNGKEHEIGFVTHEGKDRPDGGYYTVHDHEGNKIFSEAANQIQDSYVLYQNGKKAKVEEPIVRDAEHDKNVLQKAVKELLPARDIEITDELLAELMKEDGSINRSALMRKLKIGYNKAGDIANKFEADRLIPPAAKEIIEENKAVEEELTPKEAEVSDVSDEEWSAFIDTGKVAQARLENIADRISRDIKLTDREVAISAANIREIEAILKQKQEHENEANNNANDLLNNEQNAEEVEIILNAGLPLDIEGELGARQGEGVDNGAGSGGIGEGGEQGAGKDKPNVNEKGVAEQVPNAEDNAPANEITPAPSTIPAPSNLKSKWTEARKEGKYTEDTVEHTRNEPLTNVVLGAEGTSNFSAGPEAQNVPFRYALVTLDEVEPTHKGVRENPENFIMEGQPKADVSKEALSARDVQNQTFAKQFNNTQQGPSGASPYNGFSNVNQRGEVFQGTGRWNILNHYYNTHAGSYEARIEYLKSIAAQLGLTGEQIDEFVKKNEGKKVDVVKMYNVTDDQAIRLGQYDQKDAEAKVQGAAENQMAAKITPAVLAKIRSIIANAVTGDSRGLQILQAKAKAMIDALVADGVITAGEYQGYFDANGNPQVSAITAIQDILLRVAYPNNASIVSSLPGAVKQAISKSLPFIISVEESKSISSAIDKAIGAYNEYFRETGEKGNVTYMPVDDWLNTVDTLRGQTKKSGLTALEQELVKLFAEGKENQIEAQLRDYQQATVGTNGLFGSTPALSREDAVNKVFGVDYADKVVIGGGIARNNKDIQAVDDKIAEIKNRMKNKGPKGPLMMDPTLLADCVELAYYYAKKGYLTFSDFVKQMLRDGMSEYQPYFKEAYQKLKDSDLNKEVKDGLSEDDEIDNTNISELEKSIENEKARAEQILEASKRRTQELATLRVESREEFNGTDIAEGSNTRPALRYSYEQYIPNVPVSVEKSQYPFLNKYQVRVVNLILSAFKRGKPGFLLGDDTGTGKTATLLVTANEIALMEKQKGTNRRVLIVTMNLMVANERFKVDTEKINKVRPLNPVSKDNGIVIATYGTVEQYSGEEFAAILYDESQEMANMESQKFKQYKQMKTGFVVFASATPFQTPLTSLYALARVVGATEEQIAHELGFAIGPDKYDEKKLAMLIPGGEANDVAFYLEYAKRIGELAKEFIADGLHVRRSYPFWGRTFEVNVSKAVPAQYTVMMNNVLLYFNSWISNIMDGKGAYSKMDEGTRIKLARAKGKERTENSEYLLEMAKINSFLFSDIKSKLANGQSVIVATKFKGQVNSKKNPDVPKGGKYWQWVEGLNPRGMAKGQYMPTATQLMKDWLVKEGIPFGEITGNVSDVQRKRAMHEFQSNKVHVILMTMDSGGTGIDLDDQFGSEPVGNNLQLVKGRPRVMYVTSQGWSASQLKQLLGRISRLTTMSPSEVHFLRIPEAFAEGRYKIRSRMKNNILAALNDEADVDMAGDKDYMQAKEVESIFNENKEMFARKNISNLADAIADWNQAKAQKMSVDQWEELIKKC